MSEKSKKCIVVWDDESGYFWPFGDDHECEGAIHASKPVRVFPDRTAARKAIVISTAWAKLRKAQGKVYNSDFIEAAKCIKIIPVVE